MVLVVKLKNPNRKVEEPENDPSPAAESVSSQEYTSAAEQGRSPTPPALFNHANIYPKLEVNGFTKADANIDTEPNVNVDAALDELSSALQQAQISNGDVQAIKEDSPVPTPSRPAVDVLIAPAVLGHRWIRTRSNSFVVERPERVRAVSLGIAALLAKLQSTDEKLKGRLESITSSLASLNVQTVIDQSAAGPLSVHFSRASVSLVNPSAALKMVHALEEEYLSAKAMGDLSPYHSAQANGETEASMSTAELPLPYTSFLDKLCSQAPSEVPPPPPPRSARSAISPSKAEEGYPSELHHPSEVPMHLPQGDLYLCGPKQETSGYFARDRIVIDEGSLTVPSALPRTPDGSTKRASSAGDDEGEEHWKSGGSRGAIEAALGTGCAAVDRVVYAALGIKADGEKPIHRVDLAQLHRAGSTSSNTVEHNEEPALRSFVLVRPPGHHCNATQPSGFCWVNNVAVMAAHAYEQHGIDRVAILDFDLHHGNGTQAIAWRINAETVRHDLEREAKIKQWRIEQERKGRKGRKSAGLGTDGAAEEEAGSMSPPQSKRGLKVFYGSLHDIESFPCEDGNKELVTDASMCIDGAHGQWIWNVHLDASSSVEEAQRLYDAKYSHLLQKAQNFFSKTDSSPESSLILISAGFDACTHETPGMQRHGKNVPPQFYEVFTRDAVAMADKYCAGKCVSILEGGYSDRALTSGAIAHLIGLGVPGISEELYQSSNLYQLEKVAKMASSGQQRRKTDALTKEGVWLEYAMEALRRLDEMCGKKRAVASITAPVTPSRAMLDELWKSPRETRRGGGAGMKPSPIK